MRPVAEDFDGYSADIEEDDELDPNSDEARGCDPDWIYDRNRSNW